jgi:hypothetical protein
MGCPRLFWTFSSANNLTKIVSNVGIDSPFLIVEQKTSYRFVKPLKNKAISNSSLNLMPMDWSLVAAKLNPLM